MAGAHYFYHSIWGNLVTKNSLAKRLTPTESAARGASAFVDFYRCPLELAPFHVKNGPRTKGFFRFGSTVCYGTLCEGMSASSPTGRLFDANSAVQSSAGVISLCFDPTEVVDNLQRERYVTTGEGEKFLHKLYYLLRPGLPFPVRIAIQRLVVARRRSVPLPGWPIDCSVQQIFESMMRLALEAGALREIPFIWFWPEGHDTALMLTHDVEEEDGAGYCETLMDIDDSFGLKAAFQFIPESRYEGIDQLIHRVRERGFEANLHDLDHDGRLYEDRKHFEYRLPKINAYAERYAIDGFRAAAMHRNHDWSSELDFQYDMSVPTASHLEPQRGGCCSVMPYFNGKLLELPLTTVQDHGLYYILGERSIDLWKRQIETIASYHGLISFIVHPDYVLSPAVCGLYRELLEYLSVLRRECDIWTALPGDINRWWRERNQMQLVQESGAWQVRGRGSERARVAYASLVDGKVRYRIEPQPLDSKSKNETEQSMPPKSPTSFDEIRQ